MSNCGVCGQTNNCACFFIDSCQAIGEFYVDLPGTAGNFISTPDSAALSITGDIDIRIKVSDVTQTTLDVFVGKFGSGQRAYLLRLDSVNVNRLNFVWRDSGGTTRSVASNADLPALVSEIWIRVTLDVDNGAGGHAVTFYTSADGTTWTLLGTPVSAGAFTTSIIDSTAEVQIGNEQETPGRELNGNIYYAEIRNGIDGPIVGVFDPVDAIPAPTSGTQTPSTVTSSSTGEVWTLNGAGWVWGQDSDESCVTVLGNGFGSNHSTISPDFDPLFPGPFKFKSSNTPDPYPMGYIFRSTTQVIPALTHQVIEFDSSAAWPGNMENFAANPYALTVVEDGIYLVGLNLATLDSAGAEDQIVYIRRNGTIEDIAADKIGTAINGTQQRGQSVMALISLVAGDYLEGVIFSGTSKTISITVAAGTVFSKPHLWARWMGAL